MSQTEILAGLEDKSDIGIVVVDHTQSTATNNGAARTYESVGAYLGGSSTADLVADQRTFTGIGGRHKQRGHTSDGLYLNIIAVAEI